MINTWTRWGWGAQKMALHKSTVNFFNSWVLSLRSSKTDCAICSSVFFIVLKCRELFYGWAGGTVFQNVGLHFIWRWRAINLTPYSCTSKHERRGPGASENYRLHGSALIFYRRRRFINHLLTYLLTYKVIWFRPCYVKTKLTWSNRWVKTIQ